MHQYGTSNFTNEHRDVLRSVLLHSYEKKYLFGFCGSLLTLANRTNTDLLWPAHRQGVVVIRLLGVVIRAHFVDIESHIVPHSVSSRPARQRT